MTLATSPNEVAPDVAGSILRKLETAFIAPASALAELTESEALVVAGLAFAALAPPPPSGEKERSR